MKKLLIIVVFVMLIAGCQPANVTAVKWDHHANGVTQTRCERVDIRRKAEMENIFSKYDGWNIIYISEYTTGNILTTDSVVCFERVK